MKRFAAVICVLVLGGCAEPPPEPQAPTTTRPAVSRVLDISAYASADTVCDIVPVAIRKTLGVEVFSSNAMIPENPQCSLQGRGTASVQLFTQTDRLARAYAMDRPGGDVLPHFVGALTIGGQPAAHVRPGDLPVERKCMTVVALSETSSLEVTTHRENACAWTDELAGAVVGGLG